MPQSSVPTLPSGSPTATSYLYNQHQHPLNSQPQQHPIYTHPISNSSRASLSLSYAPGPSTHVDTYPNPARPSPYPQHHQRQSSFHEQFREDYASGVDVAAWVKTAVPMPEQGTSRATPLSSKPTTSALPRLSVAAPGITGVAGPASSSSIITPLSKTHIPPPTPHHYHHQRNDSGSSTDYAYSYVGSTIAVPYAEEWRRQEAQTRGWDNKDLNPAYVFPVRASAIEHSHHHQTVPPPMMSYGLPAQSPLVPVRQSNSAAAAGVAVSAMQEFAGGGISGTSRSAASRLDSSSHNNNNGSSHDPASSAGTLDVYNSQSYGHHLPPLHEYHHPRPPPSRSYPAALRFPQPYHPAEDNGQYTIPPPQTSIPSIPDPIPVSTRASISSSSSSTMHSNSPPTYPVTPAHSQSPEQRPSTSFIHTSPTTVANTSIHNSPVVSTTVVSADVSAAVAAQRSSGSPEAAPRLAEPIDEMNLIPEDGTGAASSSKEKQSIFECPGCDLTFTRLSALKQHMLSHTGEKPHACDHCGRRFSLASNLRRHTTTKACKVLKFQAVKENIANSGGSAGPSTSLLPAAIIATPAPLPVAVSSSSSPEAAAAPVLGPVVPPTMPASALSSPEAPKKDKKRKATSEKPSPRRKRHANFEARWIPRTLALFKNAHLLTSTPPFQFCMYKAKPIDGVDIVNPDEETEEPEPFTRPTVPLHPVRPSMTSRASVRSMGSVESAVSSGSSSSSSEGAEMQEDEGFEERNSYESAEEFPYHPSSWKGKLPGPGLLGGDELVKNPSVARRWMTFKR